MTLPAFVDANYLRNIQPMPRGDRRRIASSLVQLGLFRSDIDYTDESAFYSELLALYARGPGGLYAVNDEICAISYRAASRRRLATSFFQRRVRGRISNKFSVEAKYTSTPNVLMIIAKQAIRENRPDICIDALWIAWLYEVNTSDIQEVIKNHSSLRQMVGGWPIDSGLSVEDMQLQISKKISLMTESVFEPDGHIEKRGPELRLELLLKGLEEARRNATDFEDDTYPLRLADAHRQMHSASLLHGTAIKYFGNIWKERNIRSRQALGLKELNHQRCFKTYGAVYASVGVMYPQRQVAFALSPSLDTNSNMSVDASPWDSGTFYYQVASKLGLETNDERARVYHEYALPAPFYRAYLANYVATCFARAEDYLRGKRNSRSDPLNVMAVWPNDLLVRVFEAHLSPAVALRPEQVDAVFLPSPRLVTRELREVILPELRRSGVRIEYYGKRRRRVGETNATPADLQRYVAEWMCKRAN